MTRSAAALLACLAGQAPAPGAAEVCPPTPEEQVRVAETVDGDTLLLADGRTLRLVSALAPKPHPDKGAAGPAGLPEIARAELAELAEGRELALAFTGQKLDRHGRLLAHAFVEGDPAQWLQGKMIDRGLALAYSLVDNYRCVRLLLGREAVARDAGLGLWATERAAVRRADRPRDVARDAGRFAIVEGRILSVGERPRRTYLNFGTNWSEDFTVFVDRGDLARFEDAGIDLKSLQGRLVRVRGGIRLDRGPAIQMTHPEQIELVDAQ